MHLRHPGHVAALALLATIVGSCAPDEPAAAAQRLTVFAAASTTHVMQQAAARFEAQSGVDVVLSFGSSSNLARQIIAGAPADVFLSADAAWMDHLDEAGAIRPETRQDLLANDLVLIAPAGASFDVPMTREIDPTAVPAHVQRIVVGDPAHVPVGRYARQALEALDWWTALEPRIIPAQDARAALRLVEIGEADAGIAYGTDAKHSDRVDVIAAFPNHLHEPIRYPIAQCTEAAAGEAFINFLRRDAIRTLFEDAGFRVLTAPRGGDQ